MLLGVLAGGEPIAGVIRMPALGESLCRLPRRRRHQGRRADPLPRDDADRGRAHRHQRSQPDADQEPELLGAADDASARSRRFFNDCYPFALLAMGQIDVVVDSDLQPYDYLPIVPVVEAAGGVMTDWRGEKLGLKSDGNVIAAATPELHREIMNRLR